MPLGAAELRVHPEQNGGRNEGVFSRAGVLQKHFRRDELLGAVVAAGLQVDGIVRSCHFLDLIACARPRSQQEVCPNQEKVEYPWWTEFSARGDEAAVAGVAEALGSPHPHDWLLLATVQGCTQPAGDG